MIGRRFVTRAGLLGISVFTLTGCAKISAPQPPQVHVPSPATDLKAAQRAGTILLSVSMPQQNTDGSRVQTLGAVEVFRRIVSRGDHNPIQATTFLAQAERILLVQAESLGRYLSNGMLIFRDSPAPESARLYADGFVYAIRFINRKNQTAGLSNQAYVAPVAIPVAPRDIAAQVSPDSIHVTWATPLTNADGSKPARIAGYNIYRTEDPGAFPAIPLNAEPLAQPEFTDRSFAVDKNYYYEVTVVGSRQDPAAESLPSAPVKVDTADVFPPGMPKSLACVPGSGFVMLLWSAPDDTDVAGYRVYRTEEGATGRILMQEQLVTTLSFRDDRAVAGKKYQYAVAAVDAHNNEGPAATVSVEVR